METSKLLDLGQTELCKEILRPFFAGSAYRSKAGVYITADLSKSGHVSDGRLRVVLEVTDVEPDAVVSISTEEIANYCREKGANVRQLYEELTAYYFVYYKTMQCAIIKADGRRTAAKWAREWRAKPNVFAPMAEACRIMREQEREPAMREHLTHDYTKCLILRDPAFIYNDMPVYLRKYADGSFMCEQAERIAGRTAPKKESAPGRNGYHPMSEEYRKRIKGYCFMSFAKNFDCEERVIFDTLFVTNENGELELRPRNRTEAARLLNKIYEKEVCRRYKEQDHFSYKEWVNLWGEAYGVEMPKTRPCVLSTK